MPVNVEIKARIESVERVRPIVETLSDAPCQVLDQEDTFFGSATGRLKLRLCSQLDPELIYYNRTDIAGPKQSEYTLYRPSDPETLRDILAAAVGIVGIVRKRRLLYMVDQTRVHLDVVQGLGEFIELEVVLRDRQTVEEGERVAEGLMKQLNIRPDHLVTHAYIDMLREGQ